MSANGELIVKVNTLECIVKAQQQQLEAFRSGERYMKLQKDFRRVIAGYERTIKNLNIELGKAHAETVNVRNIWFEQCDQDWQKYLKEMSRMQSQVEKYQNLYWETLKACDDKVASLIQDFTAMLAERDEMLAQKNAAIIALTNKLEHITALRERNSTNTSMPTSQTPIGKKKHIPNTRRSTGKSKGGQPGHVKHILEKLPDDEITDTVIHSVEEDDCCPNCGCDKLIPTGEYENKDEIDIEVIVKKTRHKYAIHKCECCGQRVRTGIQPNHRAECQYGANVQAICLSLMNTTNAAINKVPMLIEGLTKGEVCPSDGYVAKLQRRASQNLKVFRTELELHLIKQPLIYWDDTVVMLNTKRGCMRFYGTENISLFKAHEKKDLNGILEDGILSSLPESAKAMHDHNIVNYNKQFAFQNIECNIHLERDLQKIADDTSHTVLLSIKELIAQTIHERKKLLEKGIGKFEEEYIEKFNTNLSELLEKAEKVARENDSKYSGQPERALVERIKNFRENYFAWVYDFTLPTTNNLSERALRGIKSKMKISGQFSSVETSEFYADIRTYIDTCRRNGINEMEALTRLCNGTPYTVQEIFG